MNSYKHEAKKPYTVYLAGPMTSIPAFNFPLFFAGAEWLRGNGWTVLSPAEKDLEQIPWDVMVTVPGFDVGDLVAYSANSTFDMGNAMEWDLPAIMNSDGIVMLPGWENSTGARWERTVAEALGRTVWLLTPTLFEFVDGSDESVPARWHLKQDDVQLRLTPFLRGFPSSHEATMEATVSV